MDNPGLASILINNYNYGQFVGEAIDSALEQTYTNCEVIVVDDGSTDSSRQVIDRYQNQARVKLLFQENGGQAAAMNAGFQASQGEIIFLLDSDDIFDLTKVDQIMSIFESHPQIAWCIHPLLMVNSRCQEIPELTEFVSGQSGVYDISSKMAQGTLSGTLPIKGTATSAMCFRRSFLERLFPIPEQIRITSDNYIKYAGFGLAPGYVLLEHITQQRIHDSNAYTMKDNISNLRLDVDLMTAYWLRKNFPILAMFSHNLFAMALVRSHNIQLQLQAKSLIKLYRTDLTWQERLFIRAKQTYYKIKMALYL